MGGPIYLFLFAILFLVSVLFLLQFVIFFFQTFIKLLLISKHFTCHRIFEKVFFSLTFSSTLFSHFTFAMDPPQNFMETTFRGRNQRRRFEALSQRDISLTLYHDEPTMYALGIADSVYYMLNQLGWERAHLKSRFITYRELTLEFLSSLVYIPEHGIGARKGLLAFRLFGIEFTYNHRDLADLLGFPSGPFAFTTTQVDLMDFELDYFWGTLTGNYHPEPDSMDNNEIHNPAIRYFHKILAHTIFGKEQNQTVVSKDEVFLLYCMNQGRPVNAVPSLPSQS